MLFSCEVCQFNCGELRPRVTWIVCVKCGELYNLIHIVIPSKHLFFNVGKLVTVDYIVTTDGIGDYFTGLGSPL